MANMDQAIPGRRPSGTARLIGGGVMATCPSIRAGQEGAIQRGGALMKGHAAGAQTDLRAGLLFTVPTDCRAGLIEVLVDIGVSDSLRSHVTAQRKGLRQAFPTA